MSASNATGWIADRGEHSLAQAQLLLPQVRRALDALGENKVDGLCAGRPAIPTGRLILQTLATMVIIPATGNQAPIIAAPTPRQTRLYELLDID